MNKPIKNIIYLIILIISIVLVLIYSTNILGGGIQIIKHTSSLEAEIAINNKYLNHNSIENDTLINANSYTIVKVPIKKLSSSILPLTVKPEHQFHVFQNNHLIYSQLENNYYQGFSSQRKTYSLLASDYLKVLHHIPLHSHDPIYLLIKKQIDQNINSIVSLPDVKQKNLQSLKETQIPIIKINTHNQYLATEKYQFTTSEIIFKEASYTTLSKIRIRGTSSVHFPKKQLNIIFEEESILNEVKLKKNVLVSAFNDKSLMRNKIADNLFSVFNQSSSYVHLIINDFNEGFYLLREHPEI